MCTISRATGRAASGLVTLAVLMLLGCERLPDSYGVYYKKNGRWTPINESTAEVQLPARPEILVFDRRLAMAPVPPEAIVKFERRQLVRRKIELVMIKPDQPPQAYSVEDANEFRSLRGLLPVQARPVEGHNDMVIVAPAADLTTGAYRLTAMDAVYPFGINIEHGIPDELQADKWYTTLSKDKDFSWNDWLTLTQKDIGEEHTYHGRTISRIEYKPLTALPALTQSLHAEWQELSEKKRLVPMLRFPSRVAGIDPALSQQALATAMKLGVEQVDAARNSGDAPKALALVETIVRARAPEPVNDPAFLAAHQQAAGAYRQAETAAETRMLAAIQESQKQTPEPLAVFAYQHNRTDDHSITITANYLHVHAPTGAFKSQSTVRKVWMGNITQMSRSTHSPGFGSEDVYAIQLKLWDDDSYGSTVLLTFNDAAHRDACYAAVHSARTKWFEQYGASCTATVDAHSGYWGHSVFPGGYAWNLWVRPESANVDAINESGEVFSDIMHSDKSLHCKQSLRFRAVSPENAQITLRMFRSFTADDAAGLPTQTQQQRQLADLVLAVEAKPESAEAAFNLAVHKLDVENDAKRGEALLRDVLRLNTKHIDARRRIARLRYREGAYADAVRHYSEILDIDASLADVYVARAEACRGAGFTDRVAADYDKAISLDPKFARAYTGRSRLNLDLGQFSQAAEDATRAMQLEPKSAEGVTMRAIVRYVQRDWPGALTDTQAALEIEGRHHDFCQIQAWLLRHRTGDAALAKEKLSAYRQQRSVKSDWFDTLCSFLLRQNMEEDFLKSAKVPEPSFAPRRREANEHGEAWFYVGMLRLFSGKNAEAAEAFDRCCRIGQQTWLECKYADMELEALNRQARAAADAKREADDRARVADERRRAEEQRASLQSTRGMSTSSVGTTSVGTTPVGTRPLAPTPLPVPATIVNRMILPLDISIDGGPKHTIGPFDTYKTALTPGVHRITGSSLSGKLDIRFDLPAKGGAVGIDGSMLHR